MNELFETFKLKLKLPSCNNVEVDRLLRLLIDELSVQLKSKLELGKKTDRKQNSQPWVFLLNVCQFSNFDQIQAKLFRKDSTYEKLRHQKDFWTSHAQAWRTRNGILLPKLFWTTVRKNCSSDREKVLKFEAEGRAFAKILR